MTIILFLVDTSSSMCQKAYVNGVQKTYLDIAKGAVETFLKYRQRTQDCLGDRYMLLTFEEPPANVKAGWKENHATFMNELKNLQSHGLTSMGESLRNAFDLLNLNRMQSGIDTYGQGRCPFYLEPSVIIVITDGGRYSYRNGVHQEIILPLSNQIPGTKFTKEPFRWDQRLFSLVLRMPGNKVDERVEGKVPHDDSPIERMCEVTGGRSYRVRSHYVLNQCIESLVQKVQPGVVLQFEPMVPKETSSSSSSNSASVIASGSGSNSGSASNASSSSNSNSNSSSSTTTTTSSSASSSTTSSSSSSAAAAAATTSSSQTTEPTADIVFPPMKKMIYVQKHITQKTFPIGYWPLPEPYWPDSKAITLPPRDAHPKLKILTPAVDEPQLVRSFPVDKYEIEGCPLTLQILNKREMNKCWQVIVTNGMHGFELPFGYLRAAPNFSQVHLYVLAYNYPALLPLLHDLIHKYNMSPPNDLMYKFNSYVRSIPPYYCPFLRKALVNINVPYQLLQFLLPENVDNYLSPTIANQLKHIKNTAKQDQENLCLKVYKQLKQPKPPYRQVETAKLCTGTALRRDLVRHPMLRDTFAKLHAEIEPVDNYTIVVPQLTHQSSAKTYRNPFDIPRRDLVDEIARMRESFLRPSSLVAKDSGHCLPIAEMGNYQEYLKNKDNPLREIEPTNVRQHMFGNPYKKDKHMVMVDEADLSDVAPMKSSNSSNLPGGSNSPSSSGAGGTGGGGLSGMGLVGGGGGMSNLMLGGGSHGGTGIGGPMGMSSKSKLLDGTTRGRKRKAGPLPRAFEFRRASTDSRRSGSVSPTPSTSSNISTSSIASIASGGSSSSSIASAIDSDVDMLLDDDSNSSFASDISNDSSSSSGSSSTSSNVSNVSSSSSNMSTSSNISSSSNNIAAGSSIIAAAVATAAAVAAAANNSSSNSSVDSGVALERGVVSSSNSNNTSSSSFDFNEEEACEPELPLNGYVHNFINGISEEERANEAEINIASGSSSSSNNIVSNTSASSYAVAATAAVAAAATAATTTTTAAEQMTTTTTTTTTASSSSSSIIVAPTTAATVASNGASDPYSSSSSIGHHNHNQHNHHHHHQHHNHHSSSGVLYVPLNGLTMQHAAYSSNVGATLDNTMLMLPPTAATAMHKVGSASAMSPLLLLPNGYASHHGGMLSPPAAATATTSSMAASIAATTVSGSTTNSSSSSSSTTAITATPAATTTTTSTTTTSSAYFSHNDINDASEISRILQTCHNGNSGSSSSNISGSNTLNGNANDANGHDLDTDMETGNSFDALKRTVSGSSSSTVGSSPHFYWGSGLNHSSSNNNSSTNNNNNNNSNSNSNSNNNISNQHRSLNNSSPKLDPKASPTHSNHSNSSTNSNSNSNSSGNNNNNHNNSVDSSDSGLSEEQREAARQHNIDLRLQIFRDIRRPGRDYTQLLEHLNLIKGDQDMKSDFIEMCISESMRFRRHQMVCSIQEWWESKQPHFEITKS